MVNANRVSQSVRRVAFCCSAQERSTEQTEVVHSSITDGVFQEKFPLGLCLHQLQLVSSSHKRVNQLPALLEQSFFLELFRRSIQFVLFTIAHSHLATSATVQQFSKKQSVLRLLAVPSGAVWPLPAKVPGRH